MLISELIEKSRTIYDNLADNESKQIFRQRLIYSFTSDPAAIHSIAIGREHATATGINAHSFVRRILPFLKDSCIVFGAGFWGEVVAKLLIENGIVVECFYDNNAENYKNGLLGRKVVVPPLLKIQDDHTNRKQVIIASIYCIEILNGLLSKNYRPELLFYPINEELELVNERDEYFDEQIISFGKDEVFVDGGCFDFKTCEEFLKRCPDAKKIYAFECDSRNIPICEKRIEKFNLNKVTLLPYGLWDKTAVLAWDSSQPSGMIMDTGDTNVKTVALDDVVDDRVTFIKLDIEGAELQALRGAKNIIQKYRPKLAICVYHKPEDIITIPSYIKELVPDYKLILRHYSANQYDTVLYAI